MLLRTHDAIVRAIVHQDQPNVIVDAAVSLFFALPFLQQAGYLHFIGLPIGDSLGLLQPGN